MLSPAVQWALAKLSTDITHILVGPLNGLSTDYEPNRVINRYSTAIWRAYPMVLAPSQQARQKPSTCIYPCSCGATQCYRLKHNGAPLDVLGIDTVGPETGYRP